MKKLTRGEWRALELLADGSFFSNLRWRANGTHVISDSEYEQLSLTLERWPHFRDGQTLHGHRISNVQRLDGRPLCLQCSKFAQKVLGNGGYCITHAVEARSRRRAEA